MRRKKLISIVCLDNTPLPERADEVTVDPAAIATLKAEATIISPEALGEKAEVVAEQACFLPSSRSTGSPILTKVKEGVFFAAGHSCWGESLVRSLIADKS